VGFSYVLGLGGTVDYELAWDAEVLSALALRLQIGEADLDRDVTIIDERDLVRSVLAFARDGVGGERHVASAHVLSGFAARFRTVTSLGGTCVRAATALHHLGHPSTVHLVSIDDTVRRLLPSSVRYLCSADRDSLDPHLIVQFPPGARVDLVEGHVVTPSANRLIYVNDPWNRDLVLHPGLGTQIAAADAILVSGLNSMQHIGTLQERLDTLRTWLRGRRPGAVAMLEDASYHVPDFPQRVRDALAREVDVWSMNEDELQRWIGREVDLLDVADIGAALTELAHAVQAPVRVVHTQHWALAHGHEARRWSAALRAGITAASTRYLVGDAFTLTDHDAVAAMPPAPAHARFAAELSAAVPDVVCWGTPRLQTQRPTTIGLGDTFVGGFLAALAPGGGWES